MWHSRYNRRFSLRSLAAARRSGVRAAPHTLTTSTDTCFVSSPPPGPCSSECHSKRSHTDEEDDEDPSHGAASQAVKAAEQRRPDRPESNADVQWKTAVGLRSLSRCSTCVECNELPMTHRAPVSQILIIGLHVGCQKTFVYLFIISTNTFGLKTHVFPACST